MLSRQASNLRSDIGEMDATMQGHQRGHTLPAWQADAGILLQ